MRIRLFFLCAIFTPFVFFAQIQLKPSAADIHDALKKLNFLGSVLYVAAHPDDENTRLISYFSNEIHANTAYLSMTRGDGGQNLIGKELRESLGIIRTQELLAARRIDGAQQYFTRANDFGFSKNPDETLKFWDKQAILNDVVWIFRKFQPDIIITRFNESSAGKTHGHHTASAMLADEAFTAASDKNVFPEQLKSVNTWQAKRLFFNTSWFFYGSIDKFNQADKTNLFDLETGVFYPLKGKSNSELAAEARTKHKSQGFGSSQERGSSIEYLEFKQGEKPLNKADIFSGINTTWSRVAGGKPIGNLVMAIEKAFNYEHPEKSISQLIEVYKLIDKLPDSYWKNIKLAETTNLIQACAGLYLEVTTADFYAAPNTKIALSVEAINRSKTEIILKSVGIKGEQAFQNPNQNLTFNQVFNFKDYYTIPSQADFSNAYWLNKKGSVGLFEVSNKNYIGLAETPPALVAQLTVSISGFNLDFELPVVYKKTDPVRGEIYRRFEIAPPVFSEILENVTIFSDDKPKNIKVRVKAGKDDLSGNLTLNLDANWQLSPATIPFTFKSKNDVQEFIFQVTPPKNELVARVNSEVTLNNRQTYQNGYQEIDYNHIPPQLITSPTEVKFVRIPISRKGQNIAYIMGAGDEVPKSLQQVGYNVTLLDDEAINAENLKRYDAVILGIRAYNTVDNLKFKQQILFDYVANGGTMIVQYNTNSRLIIAEIAPYQLHLSQNRVTVEDTKVNLLNPNHEVLNVPNKITESDFDGWVQERGLYFPDTWDAHYDTILGMNDPGESEIKSSLLVAKYQKGYFIYTGLAFFRELPAGVPGAFKLFVNLISLGKNQAGELVKQK